MAKHRLADRVATSHLKWEVLPYSISAWNGTSYIIHVDEDEFLVDRWEKRYDAWAYIAVAFALEEAMLFAEIEFIYQNL
jgi:hypothetical protein